MPLVALGRVLAVLLALAVQATLGIGGARLRAGAVAALVRCAPLKQAAAGPGSLQPSQPQGGCAELGPAAMLCGATASSKSNEQRGAVTETALTLTGGVVEDGTQVSGGEQLALACMTSVVREGVSV